MGKIDVRDVSPILQIIRNFLLGRKHTIALRFSKDVASRSPPQPILPDGPAHKLSNNYYFARDARSEVKPPVLIVSGGGVRQIEQGAEAAPLETIAPSKQIYKWD